MLAKRGFTSVRPLSGGLEAWVAAGHAVDAQVSVLAAELAT
jgi:3-mercaptopyruvate sulfurtransferase SseA